MGDCTVESVLAGVGPLLTCRVLWEDGGSALHTFPFVPKAGGARGEASRRAEFCVGGWRLAVREVFSPGEDGEVRLTRTLTGRRTGPGGGAVGLQLLLCWPLPAGEGAQWRFAVPSILYTQPRQGTGDWVRTFMEDRLTANLAAAYDGAAGTLYSLSKLNPARHTGSPQRKRGQTSYLHETQCGSLGCAVRGGKPLLLAFWPYYEGLESPALSSDLRPADAFYPLAGQEISHTLCYALRAGPAPSFTDGVYERFRALALGLEAAGEEGASLPFSLEESRQLRLASLEKTYREFGEGGAGFFFHFDPRGGYRSPPSGFGASFCTIPHDTYTHILEYGFTGRQLNTALVVARARGGEWLDRGERVVDFFVSRCLRENGWMYSLYDIQAGKPFFSFGDPQAPRLHYVSRGTDKGNYLRTMAEPACDLLECYRFYAQQGRQHPGWLQGALSFGDFLVRHQNEDGSWYRGYRPDGTPADMGDGANLTTAKREQGAKAATAIPLVFLCQLCAQLERQGKNFAPYWRAAARAGAYTIAQAVLPEHYQGGTLDNPNVVDKEAAQYAMAGLWALYTRSGEPRCLAHAHRAARLFATWNYIWNAPTQPGTFLHEKRFKTKGLGAINSTWGGGVVDIYSLFHLRELYLVGRAAGDGFLCRLAGWIAAASCQILSSPFEGMGFADSGMQPEGFGVCPQGLDEGMIKKGDIWGTLGWIYSAGIYGLGRYLEAVSDAGAV